MEKQPRTVLLGVKVSADLSDRIDSLASRMGITRSEVAYRVLLDGVGDLEGAVNIASTRVGSAVLRMACQFLPDQDDREDVLGQLDRLRASRPSPDEPPLPFASEPSG